MQLAISWWPGCPVPSPHHPLPTGAPTLRAEGEITFPVRPAALAYAAVVLEHTRHSGGKLLATRQAGLPSA